MPCVLSKYYTIIVSGVLFGLMNVKFLYKNRKYNFSLLLQIFLYAHMYILILILFFFL